MIRMLGKLIVIVVISLLLIISSEIISRAYYYDSKGDDIALLRVTSDVSKWIGLSPSYKLSSVPSPFYKFDPITGITSTPGKSFLIKFSYGDIEHSFRATINKLGNRITGTPPNRQSPRGEIWIFGDSYVWSWGNNDEQTFAWIIQENLPRFRVRNFAQSGWGNVQNLLRLRHWLKSRPLPKNGVAAIVVAHSQTYAHRNVGAPSRMMQWKSGPLVANNLMRHPRAWITGKDELIIDYIPLFIDIKNWEAATVFDPPKEFQNAVTTRIIKEFAREAKLLGAILIVAYLEGPSGDPVLESVAREAIVVDIRPPSEQRDDFVIDSHPGPKANRYFAKKLSSVLSENLLGK